MLGFDAVAWSAAHVAALNGVAVGVVVLGILIQAAAAPEEGEKSKAADADGKKPEKKAEKKEKHEPEHHEEHKEEPKPKAEKPASAWWRKLLAVFKPA